jgi:hypothetical protein
MKVKMRDWLLSMLNWTMMTVMMTKLGTSRAGSKTENSSAIRPSKVKRVPGVPGEEEGGDVAPDSIGIEILTLLPLLLSSLVVAMRNT